MSGRPRCTLFPYTTLFRSAAFKRSGTRLGGRLVVGALVDEEGDMLGVRHLCETAIGRELDAAIICEPEENELCLERSEEHTSELQSRLHLVCRLLLEKKKS